MKWLKQLFCNHSFIAYLQREPFYISGGDEYHKRKSKQYILHCTKCRKSMEIISKWNNDETEKVFQGKEPSHD